MMAGSESENNSVASPSSSKSEKEERFINLLKRNLTGITDEDIQMNIPELVPEERVKIINKLLTQGCLVLYKGKKLLYKYKELKNFDNVNKEANNEEKVVYSIVEGAGNKGIWIGGIRQRTQLSLVQLTKIIKTLENKNLIKSVKSVSQGKKTVYVLFHLEPDKSLTGGPWYNDQEFEAEFVTVLSQQCLRFLQQKQDMGKKSANNPREARYLSLATAKDVWEFISGLGISKVTLSIEDIETILETIVYDGRIEKVVGVDKTKSYRAIEFLLPASGIVTIPCGVCPVSQFCSERSSVSPKTCEYLSEWLL